MKKKWIISIIVMLGLVMASVPVGYVHATEVNWSNVVYPGVYIEDIDISGKELAEAERLIQKKYQQAVLLKKIHVQVEDRVYTLDYSTLEARYNISEVVEEAFNYGKTGSLLEKYRTIKSASKKEYKLDFDYNPKPIDEFVDRIAEEVKKSPSNASIVIKSGSIKITPEVNGVELQREKLKQYLIEQINGDVISENINIKAPLEVTKPELTEEKLSAINKRVSSFSTNFSTSIPNRINNIELATKFINGTLLLPGESFSFNETVGQRTVQRGFREAGVIIGDRIESGIGGGICQVSSTLYNAILKANLKASERLPHSLPLAYIGKGLDATVSWGSIDFRFTNTLNYPIYIEGYTRNGNVYFDMYSNEKITTRSYEITTDVYSTVQPSVKYIDDPNLNEGETKTVKQPSQGYKVKVYRKTYENGKLIKTELISDDYYRPVNGEIIRGTKKSE
jgi:vancomycin resistance protein YoaR